MRFDLVHYNVRIGYSFISPSSFPGVLYLYCFQLLPPYRFVNKIVLSSYHVTIATITG